jgi:hypothetical protein
MNGHQENPVSTEIGWHEAQPAKGNSRLVAAFMHMQNEHPDADAEHPGITYATRWNPSHRWPFQARELLS